MNKCEAKVLGEFCLRMTAWARDEQTPWPLEQVLEMWAVRLGKLTEDTRQTCACEGTGGGKDERRREIHISIRVDPEKLTEGQLRILESIIADGRG